MYRKVAPKPATVQTHHRLRRPSNGATKLHWTNDGPNELEPDKKKTKAQANQIAPGSGTYTVQQRDGTEIREKDCYPNIQGKPRFAYIFNFNSFEDPAKKYSERRGSLRDVSALEDVFSQAGYQVRVFKDLNHADTVSKLEEIRRGEELNDAQIAVFVVMSHGDGMTSDSFVTSDGKSMHIDNVKNYFSNCNCEQLKGIPKVFICVFCRNILNPDKGNEESNTKNNLRTLSEKCLEASPSHGHTNYPAAVEDDVHDVDKLLDSFLLGLTETEKNSDILNLTLSQSNVPEMTPVGKHGTNDKFKVNMADITQYAERVQLRSLPEYSTNNGCDLSWLSGSTKFTTEGNVEETMCSLSTDSRKGFKPAGLMSHGDFEDMMTIYSSKPGYSSYRDENRGSEMVQSFCEMFAQKAWSCSVQKIYTCLQREMKTKANDDHTGQYTYRPDKDEDIFEICYFM